MRARRLGGLLALAALAAVPGSGLAGEPRPVVFPTPELPVTVVPVPLGVARPEFALPAPPPVAAPPVDLVGAPLPRFATAVTTPLPETRDPGGFSCTFVAFRRAATLADCGVHRMLQGDVRGAREALEESLAVDPRGLQAPAAYVWLGEIALIEARWDQAERHYRTGVALSPPAELAAHAELGLAWLALRRGDVAEARRALAQAQTYAPPQPVALVIRFLDGVARLLAGRAPEALSLWDAVAGSGAPPAMLVELGFWRGVALGRLGDAERAVQHLERFLSSVPTTHPLHADAIVQTGWVALERGAFADAERQFLRAESASPRPELRPQLRAGLVRVYVALGDTARASDAARRLKAEAPKDPLVAPALFVIADEAVRRGAMGEALGVYRDLLGLPLPPPVLDYVTYRLGEGLEQESRLGQAKDHYRTLRDRGRDEGIAQRAAYRLGLVALRERDPAGARREGESLLRAGTIPELREAVLLLAAEAAARGNDPNRAVALFRLAVAEFPGSPRAAATRLALGWALLGDREPETALREWQEVARTADLETATLAWLAIAETALRQGHEAQALTALRQLRAAAPSHPLADLIGLDLGILTVRARADQEAIQALEPLIPRTADFGRQALVRRALGLAYYRLQQYELAEQHFREAAHVAPAEPSHWLGAGLAALAQGRLLEAEEALHRAAVGAIAEVGASASYGLTLVAVRRGDREVLRERARMFVDRYPTHRVTPVVLYALVVTTLERGELEQGDGWVRRLLRDASASEYVDEALIRLARAAASVRPALARQAYRDLLARRPSGEVWAEAWLGVAEAALALGDGADAERTAEAFLREGSATEAWAPRAYALLVRAHELQGLRDRALRAADAFLARFSADPLAPSMQLTRGQLLLEERRLEEAGQALEAARAAGEPPVAAPAQFWLGEVFRARGDHEAAVAAYLGATYLYPNTPWAVRGLQGAAQSYLSRQMPREAGILLRKLAANPGVEPALAQWVRQALAQLGSAAGPDPAPRLRPRPGAPSRP